MLGCYCEWCLLERGQFFFVGVKEFLVEHGVRVIVDSLRLVDELRQVIFRQDDVPVDLVQVKVGAIIRSRCSIGYLHTICLCGGLKHRARAIISLLKLVHPEALLLKHCGINDVIDHGALGPNFLLLGI